MIEIENVLEDYEINKDTCALLSANHLDYATIVIEVNRKLYVKKTPMVLIKTGCLDGGSTYDGRRLAMCYQTGAHNKVPIPINPIKGIYAYPTHSPKARECNWIFYHHVKHSQTHPKAPCKTIITFNNGISLTLDVSYHIIKKQTLRTSFCIVRFTSQNQSSNISKLNNMMLG